MKVAFCFKKRYTIWHKNDQSSLVVSTQFQKHWRTHRRHDILVDVRPPTLYHVISDCSKRCRFRYGRFWALEIPIPRCVAIPSVKLDAVRLAAIATVFAVQKPLDVVIVVRPLPLHVLVRNRSRRKLNYMCLCAIALAALMGVPRGGTELFF